MELLVIILLFMICVIAVAFRKDVQDRSKRDIVHARRKGSRPRPVIETSKKKQETDK